MMMFKNSLLIFTFVILATVYATEVRQCPGEKTKKLDTSEVTLNTCIKGTCRLRRKTTATVEIKFTPEKKIKHLTTNVHAEILGLPLPFVGVDGVSACDFIYEADGVTKTPCPLEANKEYIYKNEFKIHEIYPKVSLVVHWALSSGSKDIVCFEVPAKIT